MTSGSFDYAPLLAPNLPAPAVRFKGLPKYHFIGGNNDREHVPVDDLAQALAASQKG